MNGLTIGYLKSRDHKIRLHHREKRHRKSFFHTKHIITTRPEVNGAYHCAELMQVIAGDVR